MPTLTGQSFGRYHILEQLGEGGMATVYKAYDMRLECDVAVKVISTAKFTQEAMGRALKRFEREAKAVARLTHPNIVKVTDYGEYEGQPYLVMPFLAGGNLKQYLKTHGRLPWQEAVHLILPIAQALDFAHCQGVIHRDVKPANILLTQNGQPMLTDFGVAKVVEEEATSDLTGTAATVGTPEYMAPEQTGKNIDHRVDIYALGIVFYEMLTGRRPYEADTPLAVLVKQASEPLPRPSRFAPGLSEKMERVLFKALAKKPEDRFQSMAEFGTALEGLTSGQTAWAGKKLEILNNKEVEKKGVEATSEMQRPQAKQHQLSIKWAGWAAIGGLVVLVTLGLVLGIGLLNLGQKGLGPLAELATNNSKSKHAIASTSIPMPVHTPTFTFIFSSAYKISSTWTRPADGMVMVNVPAGSFTMGDTIDQALGECQRYRKDCKQSSYTGEQPPHNVALDAFWIDKTDVTNAMYALCVTAGNCQAPSHSSSYSRTSYYGNLQYDNYPVVYVDWTDANIYCNWAGARLPTEAEWEKAARGTDGRTYPWGNTSPNCSLANLTPEGKSACVGDTSAVGSNPTGASPYGVLDMAGNVWQWVNDWYDGAYYASSSASNPQGPSSRTYRVLRGGSWYYLMNYLRSANRSWSIPSNANFDIGFRCARSLP